MSKTLTQQIKSIYKESIKRKDNEIIVDYESSYPKAMVELIKVGYFCSDCSLIIMED